MGDAVTARVDPTAPITLVTASIARMMRAAAADHAVALRRAKANVRDACSTVCVEVLASLPAGDVTAREAVRRCVAAIAALDLEAL